MSFLQTFLQVQKENKIMPFDHGELLSTIELMVNG